MRHNTRTQSFSRTYKHRVALMRNLLVNLVQHERITTTVAKAKELRRYAEKAVTLGKKGSLSDRRLLLSRVANEQTVQKIFSDLAPRFKDRQGGYTRIFRVGRRVGDSAEMALIEFLGAKLKTAEEKDSKKKGSKSGAPAKEAKAAKAKAEAPKKAAKAEKEPAAKEAKEKKESKTSKKS